MYIQLNNKILYWGQFKYTKLIKILTTYVKKIYIKNAYLKNVTFQLY